MNKQKVIIRVDGNSNIGLGHIYRGIALAEMLKTNFDICFITKPDSTIMPISDVGFNYKFLPEIPFLEEPNWIKQNIDNNAIIICDGYEFKSEYQKKIKQQGFKLVYIDDLAEYHMYADVVINHSPGIKESDYKAEPYTKFALGLDYALIRQSFINFDRKNKKTNSKIETVFVSFGGADPKDFTYKVIEQLINIETIKTINVVIGSAYKHTKLKTLTSDKIKVYKNLSEKDMLKVMQSSDLAIVPASTTSIELAFVGTPMLLGYFVENQKIIYNGFVEKKLGYPLGDFNKKNFSELQDDIINFENTITKIGNIIKIKPDKNIIKLLKLIYLSIRTLTKKDIDFVFNLSNERLVRDNSYNSNLITFEEHKKWFSEQLKNNKDNFFIIEYKNNPSGQVRFSIKEKYSVIGIAISNKYRGLGIATESLILTNKKYFEKNNLPIYAYIKKTNTASINAFKKAGFKFLKEEIINNIDSFVYIKENENRKF